MKSNTVILEAKNRDLSKHYRKYGFMSLNDSPLQMFIPIHTLRDATEGNGS